MGSLRVMLRDSELSMNDTAFCNHRRSQQSSVLPGGRPARRLISPLTPEPLT